MICERTIRRMHNNSKKSSDNQLRLLRAENKRLRAEIAELKHELEKEQGKKPSFGRSEPSHLTFNRLAANDRLYSKRTYSAYLWGVLKNTSFFNYYERFVYILRKYTFITTTIKILAFILALVQSSAVFVLFASSFVIVWPIAIILSYIAVFLTFMGRKKINAKNRKLLEGKKVTVFFPTKGHPFNRKSYFYRMVHECVSDPSAAAVVVSPYFFGTKGMSDSRKPYLAERYEGNNILIIRRHYFFSFKKSVLGKMNDNVTMVY